MISRFLPLAIADGVRDLARSAGFDVWDWMAFLIAAVSLLVAAFTFVSQKRTERNTQPLLGQQGQFLLLSDVYLTLYRGMMRGLQIFVSFKKVDDRHDGHLYPSVISREALFGLEIPLEHIHLELYYADQEKFEAMVNLYNTLRRYNQYIALAAEVLESPEATNEMVRRDTLDDLISRAVKLGNQIATDVVPKVFGEKDCARLRQVIENYNRAMALLAPHADCAPQGYELRMVESVRRFLDDSEADMRLHVVRLRWQSPVMA